MEALLNKFMRFFKEIDKPYIPFLRILLVLISIKELLTARNKFLGYFDSSILFFREDIFTEFLYTVFKDHHNTIILAAVGIGVLAAIGLLTRITLGIYALIYLSVVSFDTSTGIYNHETGLTSQLLIILTFVPGLKNYSLDRLIQTGFRFKESIKIENYNNWGVKLILIIIATGYFTAGVSKIRYGGMEWLNGNTLAYYISGKASFQNDVAQKFIPNDNPYDWKDQFGLTAYTYGNFQTNEFFKGLGKDLSQSKFIMAFLAIFTVVFELFAFLIIFSKPMRTIILFIAIGFHFSIRFLMGLGFLDYQLICVSLIDWNYVYLTIKSLLPSRG